MQHPRQGDTVSIRYECRDDQGQLLEQTPGNAPVEVVLGREMLLPALEEILCCMQPGETREITLEPDRAFGDHDEAFVAEIPLEQLPPELVPEVGVVLEAADDDDGAPVQGMITAVYDDAVEVDANHPLAGQTLHYVLHLDAVKKA